jgi:hypothetical protein
MASCGLPKLRGQADDAGRGRSNAAMTEKTGADAPNTSPEPDSVQPRLGRRLLVLRVAAAGAAVTAAAPAAQALEPTPVQYRTGITDADPGDGAGYGRGGARRGTGITDADPGDGPGFGRGGYRGGPARTGLTDSDPGDGPGYGRGGYRPRVQQRAYTGINDGDPGDPSGYGTGWRHRQQGRGVTDNDPGDAPGRGRGWR